MHKLESIQERGTHKILLDFEIPADYLIPARKSDQELIIKKYITCHLVDFAIPVEHRMKRKKEKRKKNDKYWDLAREQKKLWNCSY